jgi:chromate transporter
MKPFALVPTFALLSLLAIGGANAIIPEIHRHVVEYQHWLSEPEFANLFAISQAAPGPNVLFVTLIGWHVAGFLGALTATLAMFAPAGLVTFAAAGAWDRFKDAPWRATVQAALVPLTIGLISASGYVLVRSLQHSFRGFALAILVAIGAALIRVNPLYLLALGGLAGLFGMV